MSVLLTDEEMMEAARNSGGSQCERDWAIAKAQAKKLVEWGDDFCPHYSPPRARRECPTCWQALRREVGE